MSLFIDSSFVWLWLDFVPIFVEFAFFVVVCVVFVIVAALILKLSNYESIDSSE